jgi:Fur family ferric uptake transcriptional regulator
MNERIASINRTLQAAGYRLTATRQNILAALLDSGAHVSADELAEIVRRDAPGVGRMTVYRTLDLLCQLGLLRPVYQGTGAAHFVLMDEGHHHHLVCSDCGSVTEVQECELGTIQEAVGIRFNFQVKSHLLEFYGICEDCIG